MATVKIEGKNITLPDEVVKAGKQAIIAVLVANGFPNADKADIQIEGGKGGAPAIVKVAPRSPGKGASSLDTARNAVAVAKFLAFESELQFDQLAAEEKLMLLGIATEILKAHAWHDEEVEDFNAV